MLKYSNADLKISLYVGVPIKTIPENFAFLILRIPKFDRKVFKFWKSALIFYLILLFLNVCKQNFHISHVHASQNVKGALMWNLRNIIFMWKPKYRQISKSALVYL